MTVGGRVRMYWLDTTLLVLLGIGAAFGAASGFVWQVARLASLAVAFAATLWCHDWATHALQDSLFRGGDPRVLRAAAYAGVFLGVHVGLILLFRLLQHSLRRGDLDLLDRLFGAALGAGKMALVLAAVCLGLASYHHPTTEDWLKRSSLAPAFAEGMSIALLFVPESYKADMHHTLQNLREAMKVPPREKSRPAG